MRLLGLSVLFLFLCLFCLRVVGGSHSSFTIATLTGDTLKIHFTNNLPPEACNTSVPEMWNQYHGVSVTNLHLHGMRVPDAVNPWKLKIEAGQSYNFTVKIPNDHQGGTNWYHPHSQGSSTLQAGGGGLGEYFREQAVMIL